jgi:AraC-like DNA-binding protein
MNRSDSTSPTSVGRSFRSTRIACHLGYSDLPHFTRAFRAQVGVAPSRFRNIAAGAGPAGPAGTA